MLQRTKILKRFDTFVNNLTKQDKIAIIHDADPDGVTSAVILAKLIEHKRGKKIDLRLNREGSEHVITPRMVRALKKKKINKLFTCDLTIDEGPKQVKQVEKFAEIIALDHHKIYHKITTKRTLIIKPQLLWKNRDPASYSTAKLAYDLASRLMDVTDLDWIASAGLIGDCGFNMWRSFLLKVCRRYKVKVKKNWFETELGRVAAIISSAIVYNHKTVKQCYDTVYKAKSFRTVIRAPISKYRKAIEKEIFYYVKNTKKLAEFHDDLIWYYVKPKRNIKSPLSTILGQKYKKNTVVIAAPMGNRITISARRNDYKIAMNDSLEKAIKGLPKADGGGHIPAAGATIRKQDYQKFKKRFIDLTTKKRR